MNRYLLDTHVALWIVSSTESLSERVRDLYLDDKNHFFLSIVSIWEMSIKIGLKKLELPISLKKFVQTYITANRIELLPVSASHCYMVSDLPYFHRDPFDRLIISQAMIEKITLVSRDSAFRKYDCDVIW